MVSESTTQFCFAREPGTLLMVALTISASWMIWVIDVFVGGLPLQDLLLYWFFCSLILSLFLLRRPTKLKFGILTVFLLWLPSLYLVEWSSREPFLRDLGRVQPGMTPEEVESLMGRYIHGTGWPPNPFNAQEGSLEIAGRDGTFPLGLSDADELELKGCEVYRHSNHRNFDSDWGIVCYAGRGVSSVEFSHD